ncbi:MAG: LmbE family protein, partial [Bacteroidetes bacterium]|nr:LmbE family protein [Bacteroidota bacterium]
KFAKADKTNIIEIESGTYYPSLGLSNGEIAALSRSNHKSQGFGNTGRRGSQTEYLEFLKGDFPKNKTDMFDGVNTTWTRLKGGAAIGKILKEVEEDFDFKNPSACVPKLMEAYQLIQKLEDSHWKKIKTEEIKGIISACSGLFLEAVADQQSAAPGGSVAVTIEAVNRSSVAIQLHGVTSSIIQFPSQLMPTPLTENKKETFQSVEKTFQASGYSAPYWLNQEGSLGMYRVDDSELIGQPERTQQFPIHFNLSIADVPITFTRELVHKFNDPVKGEVYRPFEVLPPVTSSVPEKVLIFSSEESRTVPVILTAGKENTTGTVTLQHPQGWVVSPASQAFSLGVKGSTQTIEFKITPPKNQSEGYLKPLVQIGDTFHNKELITIDYDHIPYQSVLMPSQAKLARIPIEKKGERIGYIKGAGDLIPESLEQIGYSVTTIDPGTISTGNLEQFDAVVMGVRAYNFIEALTFKKEALNSYVANGGTLLVQYNKSRGLITDDFAPYDLKLSRDRVTDENAEVTILSPKHPALNTPNKISPSDFDGWVQERGLYFPSEWGNEFTPLLGMHDKNAPETKGSLLVAKHGKGYYIYTGLSFFRELPAGVSGAYRLFANLLSLGN